MTMDKKYFCVIILIAGLCHGVSNASECTVRGRFPNDESGDCRGYTMCLMGGITNFTKYKLMCPTGSLYSHLEQQCTNATNYKCYPNYNCTSVGNFPDPESTDCSSYVACIEDFNGLGTARLVGCLPNMLYNATAGVCVTDTEFTCPKTTTVTPSVTVVDHNPEEEESSAGAVNRSFQFSMLFSFILVQFVLS